MQPLLTIIPLAPQDIILDMATCTRTIQPACGVPGSSPFPDTMIFTSPAAANYHSPDLFHPGKKGL